MNEIKIWLRRGHRENCGPRDNVKLRMLFIGGGIAVSLIVSGCIPNNPIHIASVDPSANGRPAQESADMPRSETTDPQPPLPEGSGVTVWAKEYIGKLIAGMDGGLYEPYHQVTIEATQQALKNRGLYLGPVNGVLDAPTMQAIYEFQRSTNSVQICGIPTPRTRHVLERGSHTDPVHP